MTSAPERIAKRDVVFAVVLSLLGLLLMVTSVQDHDEWANNPDQQAAIHVGNLLPYEFVIPLFLLVTVPVLWRRVAPVAAVAASVGGLLVNYALTGTEVLRCGVVLLVAFLFAFTAGTRNSRTGLALSVLLVVGSIAVEISLGMAAFFAAVAVAFWGVGRVVRARTQMAEELRERTAELRAARDERSRLEVAGDRARLSRELDELLQRRLAALARMADGAHPDDVADTRAAFAQIERESRRTLEEMRAAVGVLRDESGNGLAPQPALTQLEALLVSAKGARRAPAGRGRSSRAAACGRALRVPDRRAPAHGARGLAGRRGARELPRRGARARRRRAGPAPCPRVAGAGARAGAAAGRLARGDGARRQGGGGRLPAGTRGGVR